MPESPLVTVLMRREVLAEHNLNYDLAFNTAQDYELWTRLLKFGEGANVAEPLIRYRMRSGITGQHQELLDQATSDGTGLNTGGKNIHLIEPLSHLSFVALMERATVILTDSGGIREEAPSLGKRALVMRDTTERPEALGTGLVKLIGTDRETIVSETAKLLEAAADRIDSGAAGTNTPGRHPNPYGDGKAAERIVAGCAEFLR